MSAVRQIRPKERKQGRRRGRESRKWYKDTNKGEYRKSHTDQWDIRSYVSATLMRQQDVKVNKLVFLFLPLFLRILGRVLECNCFLPVCPPPVFTKGLANHSIRLYFTPFTLANLSLPLDWFAAFFFVPSFKTTAHRHTLTFHSWTLRWEEGGGHSGSQERKRLFLFRALPKVKHVFFAIFLFFEELRDVESFKFLTAKVRTFVILRLIDFLALPAQTK